MRILWKKMVLLACVCGFLLPSAVLAQHLALDKGHFTPGEPIRVRFTASAGYADNAWVGIIPSSVAHGKEAVNDRYDLTYQYLRKRTGGTLTFTAPQKPGAYDFRMHDTDSNGREVASVSFTVGPVAPPAPTAPPVAPAAGSGCLRLDKFSFAPGTRIEAHFTASAGYADNAWVGIIPSSVPHGKEAVNDRHDLTYQYLRKRTGGTLVFQAPRKPGNYDLRMHDTDNGGREVANVAFTVTP